MQTASDWTLKLNRIFEAFEGLNGNSAEEMGVGK